MERSAWTSLEVLEGGKCVEGSRGSFMFESTNARAQCIVLHMVLII